jgi:hypothetical protein
VVRDRRLSRTSEQSELRLMAREFTAADLIQSNSGSSASTASVTVSLPNPTVEGNTVLLHLRCFTTSALADQWEIAASEETIPALQVLTRPDVIEGENSWTITLNPASPPASAGNSIWLWRAEEWANIDYLPVVSSGAAADLSPTASPFAAGSTSSFTGEPYVMAFALISFYKAVGDSQPWPTISALTNGFEVVEYIDFGTGTESPGSGLLGGRLAVCHLYGAADQVGPITTSATLSGALTNINTQGVVTVYRALISDVQPAASVLVN